MVVRNIDIKFNVQNAKPTFTNVRQVQNAFDDLTRSQKLASQSGRIFEQSLNEQRTAFNSLRQSLDPVMANSLRYEKILKQVTAAQRSGAVSTKEATRVLQLAEKRYLAASTAATQLQGRVSRLGFGFQNVGLQAQDMAVQLEAGTDINRIIVQQVPQLVSSFGALGSSMAIWTGAIGAAVAIGGTLISFLLRSWDTTEDLKEAMESLDGAMANADKAMDLLSLSAEELTQKFGSSATAVREFAVAQAELAVDQVERRLRDELAVANDLIQTYGEGRSVVDDFGQAHDDISGNIRALMDDFEVTAAEANRLYDAFRLLSDPTVLPEDLEKALNGILDTMRSGNNTLGDMPAGIQAIIQEMIAFQVETAAAEAAVQRLNAAIQRQDTGVPLHEQEFLPEELVPGNYSTPDNDKNKRGGGGAANRRAREIEALLESLMTEREIVDQWREESLEKLNEANEKELEAIGGYNEAKLRLEEEYQQRLYGIKLKGKQSDLSLTLSAGEEVLTALGSFNDKALGIAKVFGAAQTLISTYQGAAEALKLPFPANLAAAATVISTGLGFLASLKAVTASSGGTASGGSTAASGAAQAVSGGATEAARTTKYVNINLAGEGNIGRSQFAGLIEELNRQIEDGAVLGGIRVSGGNS